MHQCAYGAYTWFGQHMTWQILPEMLPHRSYPRASRCPTDGVFTILAVVPIRYTHAYYGATFFSFPGTCRLQANTALKTTTCQYLDRGGHCAVPDGSEHCTWTAEPLGEIRISELAAVKFRRKEQQLCWEVHWPLSQNIFPDRLCCASITTH